MKIFNVASCLHVTGTFFDIKQRCTGCVTDSGSEGKNRGPSSNSTRFSYIYINTYQYPWNRYKFPCTYGLNRKACIEKKSLLFTALNNLKRADMA